MRSIALGIAGWSLLAACGGGSHATTGASAGTATGTTSGASTSGAGSSTSTAAATSASTGATTTASATSAGATTGTSSATTGSSTSGAAGTTSGTPYAVCPTGFAYILGNCIATTCTGLPDRTSCALPDSGVGQCLGGACNGTNLQTDSQNCGEIGLICPSDTTCTNGNCLTSMGEFSACAAGACPAGTTCQAQGCIYDQSCTGAVSDAPCSTALFSGNCCSAGCSDLQSDPANCGSCGLACPAGSFCQGSICFPTTCSPSALINTPCELSDGGAGSCCNGECTDIIEDPDNCGACGANCLPGGCMNNSCATTCATSADCGVDGACLGGACFPTACASGASNTYCAIQASAGDLTIGLCCDGACVSYQSDPRNCGGCGVSCGAGGCAGSCIGAPAPTDCAVLANGQTCYSGTNQGTCCGGTCTFNDSSDCGNCGFICPAGATCESGIYGPICATGGTAVSCGPGNPCAAGQVCNPNFGVCYSETCRTADEGLPCGQPDSGLGVCCGGLCASLSTDPSNCSGCGITCPSEDVCLGGCFDMASQTYPSCSPGVCPAGTTCAQSAGCYATSCAGLLEGDPCIFGIGVGASGDGVGECCGGQCVDPVHDPANCGACGLACTAGACLDFGGRGFCVADQAVGACAQSCGPGTFCSGTDCQSVTCAGEYELCPAEDGNPGICCPGGAGFACSDESADPNNCGSCGVQCAPGQTCSAGVCSGAAAPCNTPQSVGAFCNLDAGYGFVCCPGEGCVDVYTDKTNCGACGASCGQGETCSLGTCG